MTLVIESSLGHTFLSTDDPESDECLTCGGTWTRVEGYREGIEKYVASNGDAADECSGKTDLCHGYERVCQDNNGMQCATDVKTGKCPHTDFECNCTQCG